MNRLRLIIFREWYTRVRRRAFILGTLLVPILMAILVGFGVWMERAQMEENKVLVADLSGLISYWDEAREAWVPACPDCFPERSHLEYRFAEEALSDDDFWRQTTRLWCCSTTEFYNIKQRNTSTINRRL